MTVLEMEEIARLSIEHHMVGYVLSGPHGWSDLTFDAAYDWAFLALINAGVTQVKARGVANLMACRYAIP